MPPLPWLRKSDDVETSGFEEPLDGTWTLETRGPESIRMLVVDDDANFRNLLRTSFETADIEVDEAENATAAARRIAARHPDVIVLDVGMPGVDGVTFCSGLKSDPRTRDIPVVLLTGNADIELSGWRAGANAFLRKPFSPLTLLRVVERLGTAATATNPVDAPEPGDVQLLLYAQDFRHLLEVERGQRRLLENAYRETVVALAHALESKDGGGTSAHSERVRRYATELSQVVEPSLLADQSTEYGFILHDVGKIGIPDTVLMKTEPLSPSEQRLIETHPILGEQMVGNAAMLRGIGAQIVRSHHECWDGSGYPDGLAGEQIPLAARIFSVVDALDAMTSERPYRSATSWPAAIQEITTQAGAQFDPAVVDALLDHEDMLRRIYYEVSTN